MLSLLALLLLGAVAAAGSGVGIGTAALRRDPASLTFTVAATLFGLFSLGCLLWVAVSLRRRRALQLDSDAPVPRPSRLAAALPIVLLLALIVYSASRHHTRRLPAPRVGGAPTHVHAASHSAVAFVPTASLSTVAAVLIVLALVVLRSRLRRRPGLAFTHLERSGHEPEWPPTEPGSLARSLAGVQVPDPEEEPDPRRAVVAAYIAMTHVAGKAGAARRIDETPAEFLGRLLEAVGTSADAAGHLTSVFELARYSSRPVDESLRSSAIAALRRVRAELGASV